MQTNVEGLGRCYKLS